MIHTIRSVDADDVEQAIEIACGDSISSEQQQPRSASQNQIDRFRARLKRFLSELPADTTVSEMLESIE